MSSQAPMQFADKIKSGRLTSASAHSQDNQHGGSSPNGQGSSPYLQLQQHAGNQAAGLIMQQKKSDTGAGNTKEQSGKSEEKSPKDKRREELDADRDVQAPIIAEELYKDMISQAGRKALAYLSKDKSAESLRRSLKFAAVNQVNLNINKDKNTTKEEKSDAKQYTESNVDQAGVVNTALQKYADQTVPSVVTSDKQSSLENVAKAAYDKTKAEPKTPLAKQLTAAMAQAEKQTKSEAARMTTESVSQITKLMSEQIKQDAGFLDSAVDVGDIGEKELEQRHWMDDVLVQDEDIEAVYMEKLFAPIKKAVVSKLGVGRRSWRRSKELNEFRQKMKGAAREQANSEIDNQLDSNDLTSGKSSIGKKFYGMMAKSEAYSMSKESVNEAMATKAEEIVSKVLQPDATRKLLKEAAKTSSYAVARNNPQDVKKIRRSALSGARAKAGELFEEKSKTAVNEARLITKGDKETGAGADIAKQDELSEQVKEQVTADDVAGKSLKLAVEADTLNSGFGKIGKLIDVSTPNPGDASAFEFELKIPVSGGAYVLFGLAGEAERETDELTVSSEITFGAGFTTFGLDANFRIGLFMEGQGQDSQSVMNLLSYGLYRQMSIVAPKAADFFWGQGGKSGMEAAEEAELWAAMIEQQEMEEEGNYVDVGLIAALQGEVNAGVAELGGGIGYKRLNRYDKERIAERTGGKFGDATDTARLKEKAAALRKGDNRHVLEIEAEVSVKLGGNDVAFSFEGSAAKEGGRLREIELDATGSIPFTFGEDGADWAKITSKLVTPAVGVLKNLSGVVQNKWGKDNGEKSGVQKAAGNVLDTGTDALFVIPPFEEIGAGFAEKLQGEETINDTVRGWLTGDSSASPIETVNKIATTSSLDLTLGFTKEWDKTGKPKEWEITFEVSEKKSLEVDAEIVKVTIEKSKRLGKLSLGSEDGVKGELLGIGNAD